MVICFAVFDFKKYQWTVAAPTEFLTGYNVYFCPRVPPVELYYVVAVFLQILRSNLLRSVP